MGSEQKRVPTTPVVRRSSVRAFAASASTLLTSQVAIMVISFVQGVLVVRALGPADFGVWGTCVSLYSLLGAFLGFRTAEAVTRQLVRIDAPDTFNLVRLLVASSLLVDGLAAFAVWLLGVATMPTVGSHFLENSELAGVIVVYGVSIAFGQASNTWFALTRSDRNFRLLAAVPAAVAIAKCVIVAILWATEQLSIWTLTYATAGVAFIQWTTQVGYIHRWLRQRRASLTRLPWAQCWHRRRELDGFWRYMFAGFATLCLTGLAKYADVLVLSYFRTDQETGVFRLAKSLISMISTAVTAFGNVIFQEFSELVQGKRYTEVREFLSKLSRFWIPIVVLVLVLAALLARPAIIFAYGESFQASATIFNILLLGAGFAALIFWAPLLLLAMEEFRLYFLLVGGTSLATFGLFMVGANLLGGSGVAFASTIGTVCTYTCILVAIWRRAGAHM